MISKIHLSGMEFFAHHGCFEEERLVGTHFKVDVVFDCDTSRAAQTDDLFHTINYQTVYSAIAEIMQHPVNLLETLCYRILSALTQKFPEMINPKVTVYKINPSLGGIVAFVSVTL
ncbi:MAG: dihydroneopterin aldolase [Bacteroidales bacterium]|nr:dihydroneopterin aldolase [Bacteroidales bacterium]